MDRYVCACTVSTRLPTGSRTPASLPRSLHHCVPLINDHIHPSLMRDASERPGMHA